MTTTGTTTSAIASTTASGLTLDSSSAIKLKMGSKMAVERGLMGRNDVWHRIKVVRGAKYEKETILRRILSAVEPVDLIPVRYRTSGQDAYFMARNCGAALEMLCRSNLIIDLANGESVVMVVTLAFASIHDLKINIQPILLAALKRRYRPEARYLDLENFHRDERVAESVYCPLSQVKTLRHTLKLARSALGGASAIKYLNLRDNDLTSLAGMENCELSSLRGLDLRRNDISSMGALVSLKNLTIQQLWLDGNALCENYANPTRYVQSAKLYCPRLKMLDGTDLEAPELPMSNQYYYIEESDARKIVGQFLTHFFVIYDGNERGSLSRLYRENSLYSLSLGGVVAGSARGGEKAGEGRDDEALDALDAFAKENRNILRLKDSKKIRKLIYRGPDEIIAAFERSPPTDHDRASFRYDVMWEGHRRVLVNVRGLFRATCTGDDDVSSSWDAYAFSRTFMLVGGQGNNEYHVLNDQCHVIAPDPVTVLFHDDTRRCQRPPARQPARPVRHERTVDRWALRDKRAMIRTLMDVTTMNTEWSRTFLDNANWDAERAIKLFIEYYKSSRIPLEAFSR